MSVAWQLWLQLFRRTPMLVLLANLLRLAAAYFAARWLLGDEEFVIFAATLFGLAIWMWHTGLGHQLRSLCLPESFLLPDFRRRLLEYGASDMLMWLALPVTFAASGGAPHR